MENGGIVADGTFDELRADHPHLMTSSELTRKVEVLIADEMSESEEEGGVDKLVEKEDKVDGQVTWRTYRAYLGATGYNGYLVGMAILVLCTLSQVALAMTDWFMSVWASKGPSSLSYGWLYVGLASGSVALVYIYSIFVLFTSVLCSKNFHSTVLSNVLLAPLSSFFDVTPVGRILNRFSSDLDLIDSTLPHFILYVIEHLFGFAAVVLVCAVSTPYIIILYLPIGYVFHYAKSAFNATTNEVKRMDGITRSPLVSLVSETYQGLSTIRAFDKGEAFSIKQRVALNYNMRFNFTQAIASRWFPMRLDILGAMIVAAVAFLAVAMKSSIGLTAAGLSLTYSTQFSYSLARVAIFTAWLDNFMTSVERLDHYKSLESEADNDKATNSNWPSKGAITFESYSMRYRDHLDLALKDISVAIDAGQQIGICGRTGSGKSSLMAALFRLVPASTGRILIDGVDIATLPMKQLRSALTIIPQDPVLFSGSIRFNIDPSNEATDCDLWRVLKQVGMADTISTLEFEIAENGANLSIGQKQLICIARALLRQSKIVVLDEATASIDPVSDQLIHKAIRECFQNVTLLIIAHRLETIIDLDRIMLIVDGMVREYATPSILFDKGSLLSTLESS